MNNLKNFFRRIIFITAVLTVLFLNCNCAFAGLLSGDAPTKLKDNADMFSVYAGYESGTTVGGVIALVVQGFLGLLGMIFLILIITAGYNWMTAGGEEEKIRKAKDMIQRAIIGLIIIIAAYAITYFVFKNLGNVAGNTGPGGSP